MEPCSNVFFTGCFILQRAFFWKVMPRCLVWLTRPTAVRVGQIPHVRIISIHLDTWIERIFQTNVFCLSNTAVIGRTTAICWRFFFRCQVTAHAAHLRFALGKHFGLESRTPNPAIQNCPSGKYQIIQKIFGGIWVYQPVCPPCSVVHILEEHWAPPPLPNRWHISWDPDRFLDLTVSTGRVWTEGEECCAIPGRLSPPTEPLFPWSSASLSRLC